MTVEQQVIEDLQNKINVSIHVLNNNPSGHEMDTQILYNQIEIMKFMLYIRTGIRQE